MKFQPRLLREAWKTGWLFPLVALFAFLAGGLAVLQSLQLSKVISGVFIAGMSLAQVRPYLVTILGIVLVRVLFTILNEVLAVRMTVRIKNHLRESLMRKIGRLGPEILKNESTGELTTAALQGVDALDVYFSQYLPQVLVAVLVPITILVAVFPLDVLTGVVFLVTAPLIPMFMVLIGWMAEVLTKRQWLALARLGDYFLDTLQGITTLKLLGRSGERASEVRQASDHYRDATLTVLRVTFLSALVLELVATISTAVVAVEIGLRLLYYRLEFQQAFFILLIAPEFYLPLRNLSARYHAGMTGVTAAQRIFQLLDLPEPQPSITTQRIRLQSEDFESYTLRVRGLWHTYPGRNEAALADINLELESGKHYALVGKSGAGKSTLARALLRFIEIDEGEILLNGVDFRGWTKPDWREFAGWLPQNPYIFNATLRENITLGAGSYSTTRIEEALRASGLNQVVEELPQGLDTPLLEGGVRLSGGELQRVALARTWLRDPRFLVMDEPEAHLDPELAVSLAAANRQLMGGRTTLTIAHRLSTISAMDGIFLMENGRLAAQGRHGELIAESTLYRSLLQPIMGVQ